MTDFVSEITFDSLHLSLFRINKLFVIIKLIILYKNNWHDR